MARFGKLHKGGRPKGSLSKKTLIQKTELQVLRESIIKHQDRIMRAFFFNIDGLTHIFKIVKVKGKPDVHEMVESPYEIKQALDQIYGGEKNGGDNEFYYVQSKDPDWRAAEALMNRAHGRPTETVELSGPQGGPINITSFRDGK